MSVKMSTISLKNAIGKDNTLEEIVDNLEETTLTVSYKDYITPMLVWASMDENELAKALDVLKVTPKGAYIMGLFGGEKKKGKEEYAGLGVIHYECRDSIVLIRLHGLSQTYAIPKQLMERYNIDVYKVYYRGLINPFKCKAYNVILSAKGDVNLKNFLGEMINFFPNMPLNDRKKLEKLVKEVKTSIDIFEKDKHYVIYRCARAFTASVPEDLDKAVSESHTAYVTCRCAQQAHYYAAVLNFLAYKVIESERVFIRDQFTRPLIAVVVAGLSWKNVSPNLRRQMARLSEKLSAKLEWRKYSDQKEALEKLIEVTEFRKIISKLGKQVPEGTLEKSLNLVSGRKQEPIESSPKRLQTH